MNLHDYTFVALDLETTGLDPHKDTIIEVAAVRFRLERVGDIFRAVEQEERSMLINPGRKLEENISMITGIRDDMLLWKQKWEEVQEKVRDFIGDAIIVWHNVLFDINMFSTHGIDLKNHISLDTFELSEIFSQDAESLNLGFLGKKYKIEMESEHRALDDTKLSIELFCRYLSDISSLEWQNLSLWHHASIRDKSGMVDALLKITKKSENARIFALPFSSESIASSSWEKEILRKFDSNDYNIISLSGRQEEEIQQIESSIKASSPLLIVTPNKKQSNLLANILQEKWYSTNIYKDRGNFCSIEMLSYWLQKDIWNRKESIFILKLTSWALETKTWLLDELKYYGDERSLMELFRSDVHETNHFFEFQKQKSWKIDILLADLWVENIDTEALIKWKHSLMLMDIMWTEDIIRRKKSFHISFKEIFSLCESLAKRESDTAWEDLIVWVSIISDIYTSVPNRPKWLNEYPPGDFGETYLITQKDLWHTWYKWLILATMKLQWAKWRLKSIPTDTPIDRKNKAKLEKSIDTLIEMSLIENKNISIILSILAEDTKISFIPRDIHKSIQNIVTSQSGEMNTLLGYGINNSQNQRFVEKECGLSGKINGKTSTKILLIQKQISLNWEKTILLTTSMKHAQMLAQEYKWKFNIKNIYTQGISGGKGKMLSLFINTKGKSLLIGTIDSWIDEWDLWQYVDTVILAKVPFDPPTDPYFLARTVGMKNNFEDYSSPIAINTINTLIGRIHSANSKTLIICTDERLTNMNWGKSMKEYLL